MSTVIWHDVECGGYEADLPLWEELMSKTAGSVIELGCGAGRVTRHLGRDTERVVIGVDREPELVQALWDRSQWRSGDGEIGDVRSFELFGEFELVLAPMQLIQLLEGAEDRACCLSCVFDHLIAGGIAAFAIVEELSQVPAGEALPPLPDVREIEGWVYSSLPLPPQRIDGSVALRRLRQTVSPDGDLTEELNAVELQMITAAALEKEALEVGLRPVTRRQIPPTEAHVGSTVVLVEKGV